MKKSEKFFKRILLFFIRIFFPPPSLTAKNKNWHSFKRALVFRLDNRLGNSILILSLVQSIKRSAPHIQVDVMMTSRFLEIYNNHPDIHEVIPYDQEYLFRKPWRFISLLKNLRRREYDLVFSSSNPNTLSVSQAVFARLITRAHAVGFNWKESDRIYTAVVKGNTRCHYAFTQIDLWRFFHPEAKDEWPQLFFSKAPYLPQNRVLFWVGATGNKKLPGHLISKLIHIFTELKIQFDLAAGPGDRKVIQNLPESVQQQVVLLAGSLSETASFFKNYKVICIPDTGPMHLAAALNIPLIQIFVNSNVEWYAYQGEHYFLINRDFETEPLQLFLHKYFN